MNNSEAPSDEQEEYTPPRPQLGGFSRANRGASLSGLVSGGQPPAPVRQQMPSAPPAAPVPVADVALATEPPAEQPATPTEAAPTPAAAQAAPAAEQPADGSVLYGPPDLTIDPDDPDMLKPSPTVLSISEPLVRRFERVRQHADSNTGVVLDALRAHLSELPRLVATARRPAAADTDPFPWRSSKTKHRRLQLPIRPLAGELAVMDRLVAWVQQELEATRSIGGKTNRSEVVAAALDAYLPADRRTR